MDTQKAVKLKRQKKKKKSRTEVFSSDSESEVEKQAAPSTQEKEISSSAAPAPPKEMNATEISAAFTRHYMQRATTEFAEDLDRIRGADDFKGDALALLIGALQQGTSIISMEEQRRVVMAGMGEKKEKVAGE